MTTSPTATTTTEPAALAPAESSPSHGCVRCGARIPVSESMCERCNPLGLSAPAASQAHGTVFIGIVLAVILLAFLARLAVAGVGPFRSEVTAVVATPEGLAVTIALTNEGSSASRTTCRIADPALPGIGPETAYAQSPQVEAGRTATFQVTVTSLGTVPRPLSVSCGS
jgi:ribosomal protein L40E